MSEHSQQLDLLPMESELMSSAVDSRARTSATQENAPGLRANAADYGQNTPVLLAKYDLDTQSWKTSQLCLDGDYQEFSETWPRSGMTRNGKLYLLPMSAHRTAGSESGLWPTPDTRGFVNEGSIAMLAKKAGSYAEYVAMGYRAAAKKKAKYWPTPSAHDNRDRGCLSTPAIQRRADRGKQLMLSMVVSEINGQLNPTWVEWLMGFPQNWTEI
jgi:hypothetical protein